MEFPKKIWLFWYQGQQSAPDIVKMCVTSWKLRHPDYEVSLLDQHSVLQYVTIPSFINLQRKDITYQEYANYVRMILLQNYGGIWVDANIYCFRHVETWLIPSQLDTGIFLFDNNFKDRLNTNWFIAAQPNNYIITTWLEYYLTYFKKYSLDRNSTRIGRGIKRVCSKLFNKNIVKTQFWFHPIVKRYFRVYPYFVMHYMFNLLYLKDLKFKTIWDQTPKINSCDYALRCQKKMQKDFKFFLKQYHLNEIPLFKLSHRLDFTSITYKQYLLLMM